MPDMVDMQAMRLAVSRAMGPAPFTLGRFDGVLMSPLAVTVVSAADNSDASTDTMT